MLRALCFFALLCVAGCSPVKETLEFTNAVVREPAPGQDKSVGYFQVRNGTDAMRTIVAAQSPSVRAIELHTTIQDDGVLRMRRLRSVDVPPGETVLFATGGRHLMLFGLSGWDKAVPITLETADGERFEVSFRIAPLGSEL